MIETAMVREQFWLSWGERDCWPLTRLLLVAVVFGFLAHWQFGWNPHPRDLWAVPGGIAMILAFIVMLSSGLAHICLVALMFPICGIILCNDGFYDATRWVLRVAFRIRSERLLAVLGLCGEILLFVIAAQWLRIHLPRL